MPAPPLANTFDTQLADTTVITTTNSDDGTPSAGTAFSAVTGSPTFSTTHAKSGTLAMRFDTTATFAQTHVDWTGLGSITSSVYGRFYLYLTAYPVTTATRFIGIRTNTPGNSAFLSISSGGNPGKLQAMNAAQSGATIGTVNITLDQWVRVEFRVVSSTTVGEFEWWLYNTPEAAIASFDDHVAATGMVNGANTDGIQWGPTTVTGPASFVGWIDDVAVSSTGQIGPSGSTAQLIRPDADLDAASWTTTPLWSKVDEATAGGDVISATSA